MQAVGMRSVARCGLNLPSEVQRKKVGRKERIVKKAMKIRTAIFGSSPDLH
jgi:hypothetical protein